MGFFRSFGSGDEKGIDFLPKRVSSAVMFSIFGSGSCEEVHYCKKVVSAAVEIRRYLRRSFDLPAAGKSRWIFHSG